MHTTAILVVPFVLALQVGKPMPIASAGAPPRTSATAASASVPDLPPGYVIGPDDVLQVVFWKDKDLTTDVTVRPDGLITLPLLQDIKAAGLTPDELKASIIEAAKRYVASPTASVIVRQINSRKVYITGEVQKPGAYALTSPMTVVQLIAVAGGLKEFAKAKEILVVRTVKGQPVSYRFNYQDVAKGRRFAQNIALLPGDTVVVP